MNRVELHCKLHEKIYTQHHATRTSQHEFFFVFYYAFIYKYYVVASYN